MSELKDSKYFLVSIDSTPDLSHVDQLTVIVRYFLHGKAVERFITFLQIESHTAERLACNLVIYFETQTINFMNCRGQSYDNASNMAGRYSGMQARLRAISPQAFYIPCTTHSLNLVGLSTVDCFFFGIYSQVVYSVRQSWSESTRCLTGDGKPELTLLSRCGDAIRSALSEISSDSQQNGTTRHEANSLASAMESLENAYLSDFWNRILYRYNDTSVKLQSSTCDLKLAIDLLESLYMFTDDLRNTYDDIEQKSIDISGTAEYVSVTAQRRKRTRHFDDGQTADIVLQGKDKFHIKTFTVIINQLVCSLERGIDAYTEVREVFKVVTDFNDIDADQIREYAISLANTYSGDLQSGEFADEMIQFVYFAKSRGCQTPSSLAMLLHAEELQPIFPNVEIAIRMYMSNKVSNCSDERPFFTVALIETNCAAPCLIGGQVPWNC